MLRAVSHHPVGRWPTDQASESLHLVYDDRHRRRIVLTLVSGLSVLLDLPRAVAMAGGDGLQCEDGTWIAVQAAPEPLYAITTSSTHMLLKLAWHLGNRHTPTEVQACRLLIRPDPVLAEMIKGLGGVIADRFEPFQPEGGAYSGSGLAHDLTHPPVHAHPHAHPHSHEHSHGHEHVHDDGHGHHHLDK